MQRVDFMETSQDVALYGRSKVSNAYFHISHAIKIAWKSYRVDAPLHVYL